MKRIGLSLLVLCVALVSVAQAQQSATKVAVGKSWHLRHQMTNRMPTAPKETMTQNLNAQVSRNHDEKIWEPGTYPGGTWSALGGINDFGMAVGFGDVPPLDPVLGIGYNHSLGVVLFGPDAGKWIDLGALGEEQPRDPYEEILIQISNTGLVATHSTAPDGQVHGAAWTKKSGMMDLGTLADSGNPKYRDHNSSYASGTNKLGTLIVGSSGVDGAHNAPVVWTLSLMWKNGELVNKWKIHKLDTTGLPDVTYWDAYGVNDYGQIVALGYTDNDTIVVSAVWNLRSDGKSWVPTMLPPSRVYPKPLAFRINDRGQIVGVVLSEQEDIWIPVLWKPLDAKRTKYSRPIEFAVPEGFTGCESVSINELGDVTGDCFNDTEWLPAHWKAQDSTFSELLRFPGDWGFSWGVNDDRTAVFTYGGGDKCSADTHISCGGAIRLH